MQAITSICSYWPGGGRVAARLRSNGEWGASFQHEVVGPPLFRCVCCFVFGENHKGPEVCTVTSDFNCAVTGSGVLAS